MDDAETEPTPQLSIKVKHTPCPFCHGPVEPSQGKAACDCCMAWHHYQCWEEHGACAACGTTYPPLTAPEPPLLVDVDVREAILSALKLGNAAEARRLCSETVDHDAVYAHQLYAQVLAEARKRGWVKSARARNGEVLKLVKEGQIEQAQALCLELAEGDAERAERLYRYLVDWGRAQGLLKPS